MADEPCRCEPWPDVCTPCLVHAHGCCLGAADDCECDHGMTWPASGPWEALFRFYGMLVIDDRGTLRTFSYRGRPGTPVVVVGR